MVLKIGEFLVIDIIFCLIWSVNVGIVVKIEIGYFFLF